MSLQQNIKCLILLCLISIGLPSLFTSCNDDNKDEPELPLKPDKDKEDNDKEKPENPQEIEKTFVLVPNRIEIKDIHLHNVFVSYVYIINYDKNARIDNYTYYLQPTNTTTKVGEFTYKDFNYDGVGKPYSFYIREISKEYPFVYDADSIITYSDVNENGYDTKQIMKINKEGFPIEYEEYDENGNRILNRERPEFIRTYSFDKKNGIYKNVKVPRWLLNISGLPLYDFVSNNLQEVKRNGEVVNTCTFRYYNEDGYPTSISYLGSLGNMITTEIQYTKLEIEVTK